ncbi:hypothetical protein [Ekhidna sp.]|uniref:relaxase/mobilization nuclease domain-containing protein n=1 Tax=Ekhidna sp. TaxID=2608089 RepID=UPI0032EBA059
MTHSNNHIKATLNYITREESKPLFIGKSLCDYDAKDLNFLGDQFKAFQRDYSIKDSYYHIKVGFHPKDKTVISERMKETYKCIINEMDLSRNMSIAFQHRNVGPHFHIAVARQSFDLTVHDDSHIGFKSREIAKKLDIELGFIGPAQVKSALQKKLINKIQECNDYDTIDEYLKQHNLFIKKDKRGKELIESSKTATVLTYTEIPQIFFEHIQLLKEEKERQKKYEQKKQRSISF